MYEPYVMEDVNNASNKKLFSVISTFSGAGGSSVGYKLAGGEVLVANEFVPHAYETYKLNHPTTHVLTNDIKKLTGKDFLELTNLDVGELDIFDGSPPCTLFSDSGKRWKKFNKTLKYYGHEQFEIENLTLDMLNIAEYIKPKIIIIENVKGLIDNAKGHLNSFINYIHSMGYSCRFQLLNSKHYGVPQARRRVFIIAVRNDILNQLSIDDLLLNNILFPYSDDICVLKDSLRDLDIVETERTAKLASIKNPILVEALKYIPHNPDRNIYFDTIIEKYSDNPLFTRFKGKGSYFNYCKCSWEVPSPTITGKNRYIHPEENRYFTIKELMRIMSLPDDYRFIDNSISKIEERIGLMVAPLQMKAIAENLYQNILLPLKG